MSPGPALEWQSCRCRLPRPARRQSPPCSSRSHSWQLLPAGGSRPGGIRLCFLEEEGRILKTRGVWAVYNSTNSSTVHKFWVSPHLWFHPRALQVFHRCKGGHSAQTEERIQPFKTFSVKTQNMFFVWINQPSLQSVHRSLRKHSSSQNDPGSPNQHHNPAKLKTLSITKMLQMQRKNHLDHGWGQFSSKGPLGGLVAILCSDTDVLRQLVRHILQITAGNTNHHLERDFQFDNVRSAGFWMEVDFQFLFQVTSQLGSRGPAVSQEQIVSISAFVPFIFQFPPTKNFRPILSSVRPSALYFIYIILMIQQCIQSGQSFVCTGYPCEGKFKDIAIVHNSLSSYFHNCEAIRIVWYWYPPSVSPLRYNI